MERNHSSSMIGINEDRKSRHFRKPVIPVNVNVNKSPYVLDSVQSKMPYQERMKQEDLSRKIELLQMENDYLRGNFYTEI